MLLAYNPGVLFMEATYKKGAGVLEAGRGYGEKF